MTALILVKFWGGLVGRKVFLHSVIILCQVTTAVTAVSLWRLQHSLAAAVDHSGLTPQVLGLCLSLLWSRASPACFSWFTSCLSYPPWHSYCRGTELTHPSPSSWDYELVLGWAYFLLAPPSEREGPLAGLFVYLILGSWINLECPDMNLGMFFVVVVFVCLPPALEKEIGKWGSG